MAMSKIGSMRGGTAGGGGAKISSARPKMATKPMLKQVKKTLNSFNKINDGPGKTIKPPVQVPQLKPTPTATQANKSLVAGNPKKAQRQLKRSVGLGPKQKLM